MAEYTNEQLEKYRAAAQPLLDQGWTPGELLWLAQEKLRRFVLEKHGGGSSALEDPETGKLSQSVGILEKLFPGVEPQQPVIR